jgi:AAA domain
MRGGVERVQFLRAILSHPATRALADAPSGPVARYTSDMVLEAERSVLHAAEVLAGGRHAVRAGALRRALRGDRFAGITREQILAVRCATGAAGIALVDGQAGTGKSFTLTAIRDVYEGAGYRVVGLGPTNVVAEDLKSVGFRHAATIHSEVYALKHGRRNWTDKTVLIVDEAAMIDTQLMNVVVGEAARVGAKLILAGDDRQLPSIDRGGLFTVLKRQYGAAELKEVRRQQRPDERRASGLLAEGKFEEALGLYDRKRAIRWTDTLADARAQLAAQWAQDSAARPAATRMVFAYTNDEVATLNALLRSVRRGRGELGPDHALATSYGRCAFAAGDQIQFTGTEKRAGIINGAVGRIERIEGTTLWAKLAGGAGALITVDTATFGQFRHGYAGTVYRGQGQTFDETYLLYSPHWRATAGYVALTRHRQKTALFVSRTLAGDVTQLARQMARREERRAASMFHPAKADPGPEPIVVPDDFPGGFNDPSALPLFKCSAKSEPDEPDRNRDPAVDDNFASLAPSPNVTGWKTQNAARHGNTGHGVEATNGPTFGGADREAASGTSAQPQRHTSPLDGGTFSGGLAQTGATASTTAAATPAASTAQPAVATDASLGHGSASQPERAAVRPGAMKDQFRAAGKQTSQRAAEDTRKPAKTRRGEKSGDAGGARAPHPARHAAAGKEAARGRFKVLQSGKIAAAAAKGTASRSAEGSADFYSADALQFDTPDWIALWNSEIDSGAGFTSDYFAASSNHLSPNL